MLTELQLRKLDASAGLVSAGGVPGLYYKASAPGRGKWVLRFVSPVTGSRRDMGLGTYPEIGLASARQRALRERDAIAEGKDPLEQKREAEREAERAAASARQEFTFDEAARQVQDGMKAGFRNEKHSAQWLTSLEAYIFPKIGHRKISELRASDFADGLRPIWLVKPETASRVKQRCASVMDWCVAHEMIAASPVSVISKLLPKQPGKAERVTHQPAAPWQKVPAVVSKLCHVEQPSPARRMLEFLILTACRSGEVRGMKWSEVDFDNKVWTIPASRMKAKQVHRVPLCDRAIEILKGAEALQRHPELVFPSSRGTQLSDMALTKLLRDEKVESSEPDRVATAHGFRSSFRDWASEHGYVRDLAEKALAHTIKNRVEAAYHRTDLLEQRRPMMESWGRYVSSVTSLQN